jgi:hypothetical protein
LLRFTTPYSSFTENNLPMNGSANNFAQNLKNKIAMKTITLLIISLLLFSFSVKAEGNKLSIIQDINKGIEYPDFAKNGNEQGTVWVKVLISAEGFVQICESNSDNPLLQQWLVGQLATLTMSDSASYNTEHYLKFDFKRI